MQLWSPSAAHEVRLRDVLYVQRHCRCERPTDLVRPVAADVSGESGPTPGQVRSSRWRQTSRGLFVPSSVDESVVEQRVLEQSCRIRTYGAVTGWASLRWQGARYFDGTADGGRARVPVPLVVGLSRLRPDARVTISQEQLSPGERHEVGGIWVTQPLRAVFDEMRRVRSLRLAVVVLDMALAAGLLRWEEYVAYLVHRQAWTGVGLAATPPSSRPTPAPRRWSR